MSQDLSPAESFADRALGAWLGPWQTVWLAVFAGIAGGVLGVVVAVTQGYFRTAVTNLWVMLMHWRTQGLEPVRQQDARGLMPGVGLGKHGHLFNGRAQLAVGRDLAARAAGGSEVGIEPVVEAGPVRQACQAVVAGEEQPVLLAERARQSH